MVLICSSVSVVRLVAASLLPVAGGEENGPATPQSGTTLDTTVHKSFKEVVTWKILNVNKEEVFHLRFQTMNAGHSSMTNSCERDLQKK